MAIEYHRTIHIDMPGPDSSGNAAKAAVSGRAQRDAPARKKPDKSQPGGTAITRCAHPPLWAAVQFRRIYARQAHVYPEISAMDRVAIDDGRRLANNGGRYRHRKGLSDAWPRWNSRLPEWTYSWVKLAIT